MFSLLFQYLSILFNKTFWDLPIDPNFSRFIGLDVVILESSVLYLEDFLGLVPITISENSYSQSLDLALHKWSAAAMLNAFKSGKALHSFKMQKLMKEIHEGRRSVFGDFWWARLSNCRTGAQFQESNALFGYAQNFLEDPRQYKRELIRVREGIEPLNPYSIGVQPKGGPTLLLEMKIEETKAELARRSSCKTDYSLVMNQLLETTPVIPDEFEKFNHALVLTELLQKTLVTPGHSYIVNNSSRVSELPEISWSAPQDNLWSAPLTNTWSNSSNLDNNSNLQDQTNDYLLQFVKSLGC